MLRPYWLKCTCGEGGRITWSFDSEYIARVAGEMHVILGKGHVITLSKDDQALETIQKEDK